jgi:hypothetical protein
MDEINTRGGCACGGVRYGITGELRDVANCHCEPCRRITGHFMAATATSPGSLRFESDTTLTWYQRTEHVQYGFCNRCGSTLLWKASDKPDQISIAAGTLDQPTGLRTTHALFTAEAADYHKLDDTIDSRPYDRSLGNGAGEVV